MNHWKDSRAVQFATGATFIIVLAWWMFTGDLPFLSRVAFTPPSEEGSVKAIDVIGVVIPMLVQACVIIGANIIGIQTGIWSAVVDLFHRWQSRPKTPQESDEVSRPLDELAANPASTPDEETRSAVIALGQAAADGASTQEIMRLAAVIRKPIAIEELAKAYRDDDSERIDLLQRELARMVHPDDAKPAQVKKAGAK